MARVKQLKIKDSVYQLEDWRINSITEEPIVDSTDPISSGAVAALKEEIDEHFNAIESDTEDLHNDLESKVDKVAGKALSTEDYSTEEKDKLASIESGANVNLIESIAVNGTELPINNKEANITIPVKLVDLGDDTYHRTVSDSEKETWNNKQDSIVDLEEIRSGAGLGNTAYQLPENGISKEDLSNSIQLSLDKADTALQSHQQLKTINNVSVIGSGNIDIQATIKANEAIPDYWHINDTLRTLVEDICADTTAVQGKVYLSTVYLSDLPSGMIQAELKIEIVHAIGTNKIILFTITSENQSPYYWQCTSAYNRIGEWITFIPSRDLAVVATTGDYEDLINKPIFSLEDDTLVIN